jgi:signal peptidase II
MAHIRPSGVTCDRLSSIGFWRSVGGPRNEDSLVKSRFIPLFAAFAMLVFDQLTKHWALSFLAAVGTTIKLAGPIDFTLVFNRSNSFGLIPDYGAFSRWALTAFGLAVAAILIRLVLRPSTSMTNAFGFAFISAGALGNALDRLRLGAVVDLFDASKLGFVWVFNVADVSIDLGIALLLLAAFLPLPQPRKAEHGND